MARTAGSVWRWTEVRGYSSRHTPSSMPPDLATVAQNVVLVPGALGRRRPASEALPLTGGPTGPIDYAYVHRRQTAIELWVFTTFPLLAWSSISGGAYVSRTVPDNGVAYPLAVTFNNKMFLAYDSDVNRLHVWDGTSIRQVGLGPAPSAPTVANTGAGAYPATARFYRIQFLVKSGADVVAMSELSSSVSFTPSGAGTHASITKSATVGSATHWRIYGLLGSLGDTYDLYEQVGSDTVVATTTLDDNTNPADYSGAQPPAQGMNIPPPSAQYLLTDGNRLLMAGCWETTAAAGETTPKQSRVWFTRVLGSSDLGDDESIPDTIDQRNWIDVGENDGDEIVGLGGPIDGIVFVFKTHHIYQLVPTGLDTLPYQAHLVHRGIGAASGHSAVGINDHYCIATSEDAVYFQHFAGAHRVSSRAGVEYLGWDITDANTGTAEPYLSGVYDPRLKLVFWVRSNVNTVDVLHVDMMRRTQDGWRGGWTTWVPTLFSGPRHPFLYEVGGKGTVRYPSLAGHHVGAATLELYRGTGATDAGGAFTATITSGAFLVGNGLLAIRVDPPTIEAVCQAAATPILAYVLDYGRQTIVAPANPSLAATGSETRIAQVVHGLVGADARAVQMQVTWDSDHAAIIDALLIPYVPQEPWL